MRWKSAVRTMLAAALLQALAGGLAAQDPEPYRFAEVVEVQLVNVEAWVTDGKGNPIKGLTAADFEILEDGRLPDRPLVVASELENLTRRWIRSRGLDARFVRSWGATEVYPPEDADVIVDNTAMLHGRTAFEDGSQKRRLWRGNFIGDRIPSHLLGFDPSR